MTDTNNPESTEGLLLKVLMQRAHGNVSQAMLRPLPSHEMTSILENPVASQDPLPIFNNKMNLLSTMHYSWLHKMLPQSDRTKKALRMSFLSDQQKKGLASLADWTLEDAIQSPLLHKFYLLRILSELKFPKILPLEYLPESPYKRLLKLKKNQLLEIIDLLGIYDLAHELKRIVATKNLKNIYKCLSPKHQQFLRQCLHSKDKIITPKLHLDQWNGEELVLKKLLHRRGLIRLSIALSGQHPDLIWLIAHTLDTGRGELLMTQVKKEEIPGVSSAVALQLDNAYNFAGHSNE